MLLAIIGYTISGAIVGFLAGEAGYSGLGISAWALGNGIAVATLVVGLV